MAHTKISVLKKTSTYGPDKIGPQILKETADVLSAPLSVIFNRSLQESMVPDDWRKANVTPVFKSGSRASPCNYRPISLTCIICKIMESIIRDGIVLHLMNHNLIHSSQHGFMAAKSCQTNLMRVYHIITIRKLQYQQQRSESLV